MRFWLLVLLMLLLFGSTSCSYEKRVRTELAVEQGVDKFHHQLNQQQYHEIYAGSAPELRSRTTETEFTVQLVNAHEQLGTVTSNANVMIRDGFWPRLRRAFNGGRETITHGNMATGDEILGNEIFVWAVENDLPRLVSYKFVSTCRKPCTLGFGY